MREVGVVIDALGRPLYWHEPADATGGSLPDSAKLWSIIWHAHQHNDFSGFAHTHPGSGIPGPSHTDLTTFSAIERALGVKPQWWIASSDRLLVMRRAASVETGYVSVVIDEVFGETVLAPWASELRRRGNY